MKIDFSLLYEKAREAAGHRVLTPYTEAGSVGAAILTKSGKIYTGVNIDTACSMGFCAEHAAAAAMVTAGECEIVAVAAVDDKGDVVPPCGRCRQFLVQLGSENEKAQVLVEKDKVMRLEELLPYDWRKIRPRELLLIPHTAATSSIEISFWKFCSI